MVKTKVKRRSKGKTVKGLKKDQLLIIFLGFIFWSTLPSNLLANSDKKVSIGLHLEEWLILEVSTDKFQPQDIGHNQAKVETIITLGQPVFFRAFLSGHRDKKIILHGSLSPLDRLEDPSEIRIRWQGEGDLLGNGLINLNESMVLAIWSSEGYKSGRIIFENTNGIICSLKGVFTLISY
ncbi:MAG: hypothetical protein N3B16_07595 [Candidatus Aminicenantes bacterium]|nr:hypothetical protein [Candidatus Aminicenantes bacterium]